jgi:putative transposase
MRCRTYRYRLHPTLRQTQALTRQLRYQCELYNAALEERKGAWNWEKRSVTYFDQCKTLTGLIDVRPEVLSSGVTLCRGTLKRLDGAFAGFYRRVGTGENPGFPRFKSTRRWDSLEWQDRSGWTVKGAERRLRLLGIGEVKMNYHRPLTGVPKAITVKREGAKWWVNVRCVDVPASLLASTGREVGVDLGVVNLVALSDGELIEGSRFAARSSERLANAQRRLAKKQRGSDRRSRQVQEVARLHRKVRQQRMNAAHQLSRRLVNEFDLIVLEDLKITPMVARPRVKPDPRNPSDFLANGAAKKAVLNRSIHDAGWGTLRSLLSYKAESAGRTVEVVNPRHTSSTCYQCGHVDQKNRVIQAVFRCCSCGHEDHADSNAALNILRAGRARLASASDGPNLPTTPSNLTRWACSVTTVSSLPAF